MTAIDITRRNVLLASGVALTVGLAGCTGDDDNGDGNGNGNGNGDSLEDHLADANNYDGSFTDMTGEDEVTVTVTDADGNSYDPAAIEIDPGTTVVWEWVDDGHSVTHEPLGEQDEELFDSDIQNTGHEFDYTFDDAGDYAIFCIPHRAQGHLGGVRVVD